MTGKVEVHHVPIHIVKRRNTLDGLCIQHTCYATEDGTLADLRSVLTEDEIMETNSHFHVAGRNIGKSAEVHVKWAAAVEVLV